MRARFKKGAKMSRLQPDSKTTLKLVLISKKLLLPVVPPHVPVPAKFDYCLLINALGVFMLAMNNFMFIYHIRLNILYES